MVENVAPDSTAILPWKLKILSFQGAASPYGATPCNAPNSVITRSFHPGAIMDLMLMALAQLHFMQAYIEAVLSQKYFPTIDFLSI